MNDLAPPLKTVTLDPGDFHFGRGYTRISTLLGSCISITLWHPHQRIGGMCHYMLAERPLRKPLSPPGMLDGRYASEAFALFLQHVEAAGTRPNDYQAKLFGVGNMFAQESHDVLGIGSRNIAYGRALLASRQIPLVAEHVGGNGRRRLHFDLHSGQVWLAFPEGADAYIRKTYD